MKKILICTDGSDYAESCYHYGAWLAQKTKAKLEVVHVTELTDLLQPSLAMGTSYKSQGSDQEQDLFYQIRSIEKQKTVSIETNATEFFNQKNISENISFSEKTGDLVECVKNLEEGPDAADLVILGKRGEHSSFAKEHLGSSMERIVRHSTKPCFVANRHPRQINKIMLAFDGSASSEKAVDFLVRNDRFNDLELHFVTVSNGVANEEKKDRFGEAQAQLKAAGYNPQASLIDNAQVDEGIAAYVDHNQIDMLMMGAYGHNRIRYLIIGSTTTSLIRCCHIPVMLFR